MQSSGRSYLRRGFSSRLGNDRSLALRARCGQRAEILTRMRRQRSGWGGCASTRRLLLARACGRDSHFRAAVALGFIAKGAERSHQSARCFRIASD
jgi:hypothetical protein